MTIVELAEYLMRSERIGWSLAIHVASERRAEAERKADAERQRRQSRKQQGGA
jgi:hypothetical protein